MGTNFNKFTQGRNGNGQVMINGRVYHLGPVAQHLRTGQPQGDQRTHDHLNGNRSNYCVSNWRWATDAEQSANKVQRGPNRPRQHSSTFGLVDEDCVEFKCLSGSNQVVLVALNVSAAQADALQYWQPVFNIDGYILGSLKRDSKTSDGLSVTITLVDDDCVSHNCKGYNFLVACDMGMAMDEFAAHQITNNVASCHVQNHAKACPANGAADCCSCCKKARCAAACCACCCTICCICCICCRASCW